MLAPDEARELPTLRAKLREAVSPPKGKAS